MAATSRRYPRSVAVVRNRTEPPFEQTLHRLKAVAPKTPQAEHKVHAVSSVRLVSPECAGDSTIQRFSAAMGGGAPGGADHLACPTVARPHVLSGGPARAGATVGTNHFSDADASE